MFEQFTEFIKELSKNHIFLDKNFILEMFSAFDISIEKLSYPSSNLDCLSIALDFYKNFNLDYYNIIEEGIKNKAIVISDSLNKSYVTHKEHKAYIKLTNTDTDLIMIVHEFGHYIDHMSTPNIVPDEYWFERNFGFLYGKRVRKIFRKMSMKIFSE